jgi:flagellar motility protein MotE (MotC chaperone)
MNAFRDIRVIPVVIVAIVGFAVIKVAGLVIDGGYVFDYQPGSTQPSWAQANLNFPGAKAADTSDITGSIAVTPKQAGEPKISNSSKMSWAQENLGYPGRTPDAGDITGSVEAKPKEEAKKEDGKKEDAKKEEAKPAVAAPEAKAPGTITIPEPGQAVSPSERAILERLQSRRQELEARAREIDIRESLLKSAEKRIEGRVEEMKGIESRIATATEQKNEAEAARFKGIVMMYENMKPKDAAKVFDRLEMPVLFEIASKIAPRKMSDILGQMSPEAAERLTVELARHASSDKTASADDLPKIEGKPLPQNRK